MGAVQDSYITIAWLVLLVVLLVIEIITVGLTTIWGAGGALAALILNILDVLHDYTVSHFSTEEQFFLHSDYKDSEKHREIHRKFTSRIAEFRDNMKNGSAQVSMELLNFLRDWLIHHIQGTDHQYVDSVQRALREEQRA